jgi:replicative DNA helicase
LLQLRESGRIEQNAAVVIGLRNEDMSGAERPDLDTSTDDAPELCYRFCNKMPPLSERGRC